MTKTKLTKEERYRLGVKSEILEFFEINDDLPWALGKIHKAFAIRDNETKVLFNELIDELHRDGNLVRSSNGDYILDVKTDFFTGKIEHVNPRFAFLVVEGQENDVWIDARDLNGAVDGDTVKALIHSKRSREKRIEGEVVEVVQRGRTEMVGVIDVMPNYAFVVPDAKRVHQDIFIPKEHLNGAKTGEKVIIQIMTWADGKKKSEGKVVEVLGKVGDNNTEMHSILAEFGLPIRFPEIVEEEAENIPVEISAEEIKKRRDMRDVTTFTIDPVDAKDFDDALSIKYLENGNYEIGVHIADVSHYVTPDSELEKEAFKRATSVYLVDRVVPMLPEKLSNGLCSLRPHEDKLTFSAVFEIDSEAKIVNEWFGRTVTHSDKRFSYEEAQEVLNLAYAAVVPEVSEEKLKKKSKKNPEPEINTFSKELVLLNSLAHKLRAERFSKGSVNFETVEVRFKLDDDGKPLGIYQKIRQDTNKLIEEFMLLANKRVAEFVFNKRKKEPRNTMVYRVHESPDPERIRVFAAFAKRFGYNVSAEHVSSSLNKMMEDVVGKPEQNLLESLAVRTMAKARYSVEPLGHFGLAFPFYSHFTSPIRRYPDVMVHRLLQHYLDGGSPVDGAVWELRCKHSSEMERLATEAERASIKYKQVEFMSLMDPNRVWDGIVSGVTEFGLFVEITETASEGLVRMTDLTDDFYRLDKENYRIVGERNGKVFTFGDALKVRVKECNLSKRSMDFALVSSDSKGGGRVFTKPQGERHKSKPPRGGRGSSPKSGGGRNKSSGKKKR